MGFKMIVTRYVILNNYKFGIQLYKCNYCDWYYFVYDS